MIEKRIFTAALTGAIHTPSMSPHLPVTPEELIEEAVSHLDMPGHTEGSPHCAGRFEFAGVALAIVHRERVEIEPL